MDHYDIQGAEMSYKICILLALVGLMTSYAHPAFGQIGQTEIVQWQYGKRAAVSLTFDDGSINQFRVAVPIMNSLGLPATFFIITGNIAGSQYHGVFLGRSTKAIIQESAGTSTNKDNFFERASAIGYLGYQGTLQYHSRAGELYEDGRVDDAYRLLDEAYAKVRQGLLKPKERDPAENDRSVISWGELRELAKQGYEISSHTVTHARLAVLDEKNLVYELEKSHEEILNQIGSKHTFTIECPYGTEDKRVMKYALARYPAARNRMPEPFLEELDRWNNMDPGTSSKEYVQWQRGALTRTPIALMKSWIDIIAAHHNIWLVLVFHGVDGIGWEPKTGPELKEYFNYIKSKEDQLWVATFQDVTKYMRERNYSTVHSSQRGDRLEVVLGHDLKQEFYDLPLTLRTIVPPEWPSAEIRQGKGTQRVQVVRDQGKGYVTYQAVPNAGTVTLEKTGS